MTQETTAVVFQQPRALAIQSVGLKAAVKGDCVVDIEWSGISTGTERLLWTGQMPDFPGMGYPLVPGYESVGRVVEANTDSKLAVGDRVFVPGAQCFESVRGLFGGAAARLVVPADRLLSLGDDISEEGTLIALAATAHHALVISPHQLPDLIVGHGVLGRLLARLVLALGGPAPTVWDRQSTRRDGDCDYAVIDPDSDTRRDYKMICDASGDANILDSLIARLAPGGEILLAGFYDKPLHFAFPAAFMREARLQIAAEWKRSDLDAVLALVRSRKLSLHGLITHHSSPGQAAEAYETAFADSACLKMIIDWRQ